MLFLYVSWIVAINVFVDVIDIFWILEILFIRIFKMFYTNLLLSTNYYVLVYGLIWTFYGDASFADVLIFNQEI